MLLSGLPQLPAVPQLLDAVDALRNLVTTAAAIAESRHRYRVKMGTGVGVHVAELHGGLAPYV